jgi:hypothetical protein
MRIPLVVFALGLLACAPAPQSAPAPAKSPSVAAPSPSPYPSTAFEDNTPPPPPSRFDTRVIRDDAPAGPRFHGAPVDLDLKGADIHDALRLLAEVGRVNIVVAGEVNGTVTMKLKRVPWDQALDVIVKARGLTIEREGNVVLVRPASAKITSGG